MIELPKIVGDVEFVLGLQGTCRTALNVLSFSTSCKTDVLFGKRFTDWHTVQPGASRGSWAEQAGITLLFIFVY